MFECSECNGMGSHKEGCTVAEVDAFSDAARERFEDLSKRMSMFTEEELRSFLGTCATAETAAGAELDSRYQALKVAAAAAGVEVPR